MPSESVKVALYDIRDNIGLAQKFVEGFTYTRFAQSRLHFYAVTRALEIISEASRRLPDICATGILSYLGDPSEMSAISIGINMTTSRNPMSGKPCMNISDRCWRSSLLNPRHSKASRDLRLWSGYQETARAMSNAKEP